MSETNQLTIQQYLEAMPGVTLHSGGAQIKFEDNVVHRWTEPDTRMPPTYADYTFQATYHCDDAHWDIFVQFLKEYLIKGVLREVILDVPGKSGIGIARVDGYAGRQYFDASRNAHFSQSNPAPDGSLRLPVETKSFY